jgi:hypothetical protein
MKMRREEVAQLLFSPQFAHDLRDRQFGKNTLGLLRSTTWHGNFPHISRIVWPDVDSVSTG